MEHLHVDLDTFLARDLLDALPFGAAILDGEGELLHLNAPGRELHALGAFDFLPQDNRIIDAGGAPLPASASPLARIRAGEDVTDLRVTLVPREGVTRNLVFRAQPIASTQPGILLTAHELPGEHASNEPAEAGTALDAFAHVCHDLRAPIRALAGFSQILKEDHAESLPPPARSLLDRIEHSALKIGGMLEDILRLSCISGSTCRRGPVDLVMVAREHLADIAPERRVDLRMPARLPAWGDEGLLRLALGNLLNNALKFSPEADPVVVELGREHPLGAFFIRDEGIGFEPSQAGELFRPFSRLPNAEAFEGTGLGLAITRQVIERHGGRLWADAVPGAGATFYFILPERATPRGESVPRAIR